MCYNGVYMYLEVIEFILNPGKVVLRQIFLSDRGGFPFFTGFPFLLAKINILKL